MANIGSTSNIFRAQRRDFTNGAKLIGSRQAKSNKTGTIYDVALFDDGAEVLVPNNWYPIGYDITFGGYYAAGWDEAGKFHFDPIEKPE